MSVQDYLSAVKIGKKEYHACVNKGTYPYLPVLEDIIDENSIDREVSLGSDQIPLRLVVGTCTAGRTTAFADNFMPILDWGTEFSAKWASLSDSQVNEGIRDDIKVYEYMNKFYVLEGNKRVSVLKYFKAVTVSAQVIRKIPKYSDDPDVKIYYEFMDFYKSTKLNDIYFSKEGSFTTLMELVGITPGEPMDEDDKKDLVSCYLNFRLAYESRGGDKFDFPTGDSFLRFIHIHGYDAVKKMTKSEMAKNVAKTWAEFELLDDNSEVELKMTPAAAPKKNILSYLLPMGGGVKKLKVGFVYEKTPQDSEWCYTHELGRQYIDDTFGDQIETYVEENVIPEQNDEAAINRLIEKGCDLIFVTSSAMNMAGLKAAIAHPSVKILDCSLNISHKYIRSYYARMFEAKFITGIIAGSLADDDNVGYIADNPVYGACANINAFALGVKFVNPRAKVYLEWNSIKDNDSEENLAKKNISIISNQDMIVKRLEGMEGVRKVRYSSALVAGFTSAGKMIGALSAVIIGVLLAVAIFLISNTISVAAAFRRRENEIMRYIGATNFMIRAPFIVEGLLLGLFGAVIPLAGMTILYKRGLVYLNTNYQMITGLFELLPLKQIFPVMAGGAMALGVGIGAIVSFLTIQRHLRV